MPSSSEVETPGVEAKVELTLETPTLPNFLRLQRNGGAIDIADVSDITLQQVGAAWTAALLARAATRRATREQEA